MVLPPDRERVRHSGRVTFYAATPVRRMLQIIGDAGVVVWVVLWVAIARKVHALTLGLAEPGYHIRSSGTDLGDRLRQAGSTVAKIPLVGDGVRAPFDDASSAARGLAHAGQQQIDAVQALAHWLGLAVGLIPILTLLVFYLPFRIRFVRRATAGRRFLDTHADLDLFALRAMANQPLHVLARVDDDPTGAWRRGDRDVIERLATLELRSAGLRPPAPSPRGHD